eukprot:Ihof_evm4s334 gene=Ihof_evmTU4s334
MLFFFNKKNRLYPWATQADSAVFEIKEGSFKALGVASHVRTKLHKISQAILIPTPIQTAAIPAISHYRRSDVLIQAPS